MKGDKTQLRTPQIRPYPLQEKFKILFLGGYVYDGTNSTMIKWNTEHFWMVFMLWRENW